MTIATLIEKFKEDISWLGHNETEREIIKHIERAITLLEDHEAVVHPESSCEMTYITDCCCDLCGVQLIREDNFCRCCGKRIEWKSGEVNGS